MTCSEGPNNKIFDIAFNNFFGLLVTFQFFKKQTKNRVSAISKIFIKFENICIKKLYD